MGTTVAADRRVGAGTAVAIGTVVGSGTAVVVGRGVGSGISVGFGSRDVLEQASTKAITITDRTIRNLNFFFNRRIPIFPQLYFKVPD